MSKTAVGYTRLSQQSDTSIDRQKELIHEYADEKDFDLINIYDEGQRSSGFDDAREKYQELIEDAKAGEFDVLILRDGSRLGRDFNERFDRFGDFTNKWGVEFHTCKHGFVNPDEPMTVLQEVFRAATDDQAKREEIEKAKEEIERRKENGYFHGRPPFGLQFDDEKKHLEPDPDEIGDVEDVLELRDGGSSYREIAGETGLNKSTVSRIVNNRERYDQFVDERVAADGGGRDG